MAIRPKKQTNKTSSWYWNHENLTLTPDFIFGLSSCDLWDANVLCEVQFFPSSNLVKINETKKVKKRKRILVIQKAISNYQLTNIVNDFWRLHSECLHNTYIFEINTLMTVILCKNYNDKHF